MTTNTYSPTDTLGDVDYERLAYKYQQVFGVLPPAGANVAFILRRIGDEDPAWEEAARSFIQRVGEAPAGTASTAAIIRIANANTDKEPQDADWQRAALKFQEVYGIRPDINSDVDKVLRNIGAKDPQWVAAAREYQDVLGYLPAGNASIAHIQGVVTKNLPQPTVDPSPKTPTPDPATEPPAAEPIDFRARAAALYPWLPSNLLDQFVDDEDFGWATTGDASLALAGLRASDEYAQAFPGIRRDDGSLRMTEQEWFSTREAYGRLFQDFGLNDQLFTDRFTELMEGEVSPQELAGRLGGAYEMIHNNIPEVAAEFSEFFGVEGEAALFAAFIDPDIGQQILDHRVSVAQVAGQGLARGFDVNQGFAERLVAGGVNQDVARNLFIQADNQLQTLDDLVKRHRDPDDTFDLEEFADANVFGDAAQTRRIRRVLRAEAASFSPRQPGIVTTREDAAVTGLTAR